MICDLVTAEGHHVEALPVLCIVQVPAASTGQIGKEFF